LWYYWKLGRNAVHAAHIPLEVEGHDAISDLTAHIIGTRNSRKVTPTFKRNHVPEGHLL